MSGKISTSTSLKVRFYECDPLQIVWHGNYLKYFEEAREDFGRNHGISYNHAKDHGISTPIVKFQCDHMLPLKYWDSLEVETTFINSEAAKIIFEYRILKNGEIISTGRAVQVFLNENGKLLYNFPPFFLDWKQKMGLI